MNKDYFWVYRKGGLEIALLCVPLRREKAGRSVKNQELLVRVPLV